MSELTLELDDSRTSFRPRDEIRGAASWRLDEPAEAIEVRLFWFTRGKGDQDVGVVETVRVDGPGIEGRHEFEFSAPPAPHSFSGTLISLIWALELIVLPGGATARREIVLSPSGREIRLEPVEALDMTHPMSSS